MTRSVQYLGHFVDAHGLHTSPDKTKAIEQAPRPRNVQKLQAFLGLVNCNGKVLPAFTTTHPLNHLLRKQQKFKWSTQCEATFTKFEKTTTNFKAYDRFVHLLL